MVHHTVEEYALMMLSQSGRDRCGLPCMSGTKLVVFHAHRIHLAEVSTIVSNAADRSSIINTMAWFLSRAPTMSCFTLNRAVSVLYSVLYADRYSSCSPFIVRCSVSRWTATFSNTLPMNAMLETGL